MSNVLMDRRLIVPAGVYQRIQQDSLRSDLMAESQSGKKDDSTDSTDSKDYLWGQPLLLVLVLVFFYFDQTLIEWVCFYLFCLCFFFQSEIKRKLTDTVGDDGAPVLARHGSILSVRQKEEHVARLAAVVAAAAAVVVGRVVNTGPTCYYLGLGCRPRCFCTLVVLLSMLSQSSAVSCRCCCC